MIKIISSDRYRDLRKEAKKAAEKADLAKYLEETLQQEQEETGRLQRELKSARRETVIMYGLFSVVCILCVVIVELKREGFFR